VPTPDSDLEFSPASVVLNGLQRLGEGRQAELFAWPFGGVLKLFRSPDVTPARREADIMHRLTPAKVPMPWIQGTVMVERRPGIVMEHLVGPDQLTLLGRQPWKVWSVGKSLGRLHARLHEVVAPAGLRPLRASIREEIQVSDAVPQDIKALALTDLDRLPDGTAICHGDFHPGNVIETADGPKIIDWPNVRCGDRLADVMRTILILQSGALPPGAPFLVRKLTSLGRSVLGWRYLREYRRRLPFDSDKLEAWRRVSLISRLSYGLAEERDHLLQLIANATVPANSRRV
jgi:aminoglycoside phosphotransferase (APT) family kinase protein